MRGTTVFIDFETGGTETEHPNIQVAAIAVRGWKEVESFERKIDFDPAACEPEALALNGYTHQAWAGADDEADVARELAEFFGRHSDLRLIAAKTGRPYTVARLAAHNAAFDVPRLRAMMERAGVRYFGACWWYPLCTLNRALWHYHDRDDGPPDYRLETLAAHLGLPSPGKAHDALADVRTAAAVVQALEARECPQDAPAVAGTQSEPGAAAGPEAAARRS